MITKERREELDKLREKLGDFPIVPPKTQELIEKLVDARKPKMVLELGSGKGFSGSVILSTTDDVCLVTIEKNKENYTEATGNYMNFEFFGRVLPINEDAEEVVKKMASVKDPQKFDMIFLDCAKSTYIRMADELIDLLSPNGVLVADDCLYFGKVLDGPELPEKKHRTIVVNLRKFIDKIKADERLENVTMYNFDDGVLVATRKDYKD